MQFVKPLTFQEAIDFIGARTPIGSRLSSSEWSDVPAALRARAEFSSRVESVQFLQRTRDFLTDFLDANRETLPDGQTALITGSRAAFVEQARQFALSQGMGPLDAEEEGTIQDITSESRLGLIFDVQTQQADDYGYWRQGMDPDILDEFPAQRFIRVKDVKEPRTSHARFEDQVYLKTDPIWAKMINEDFGVPWGPWAWGCGHDVEDVDRTEAEQLGLIKPGEKIKPDEKNFNENLQASTKSLDPDLVEKLKQEFGNQLVIEGDSMRWSGVTRTATTPALAPTTIFSPPPLTQTGINIFDRESPVSDAIALNVSGELLDKVNLGLSAINQVHDDGDLPRIPLNDLRDDSDFGLMQFQHSGKGFKSVSLAVRETGLWPSLTTVHEVGHFLDLEAIGPAGDFATLMPYAPMIEVLSAAERSDAIKGLRRKFLETSSAAIRQRMTYLLKPEEIWARAYAQYVTEKSGNPALVADLATLRSYDPLRSWEEKDFTPIRAAIDKMFQGMDWL